MLACLILVLEIIYTMNTTRNILNMYHPSRVPSEILLSIIVNEPLSKWEDTVLASSCKLIVFNMSFGILIWDVSVILWPVKA